MRLGHAGGRMATLKLRVTGMTCGHCQMKVEKALLGASGVYSAVVDLSAGEAEVDFNDDAATTTSPLAPSRRRGTARKWRASTPPGARGPAPPVFDPPPGSALRGRSAPTCPPG